MTAGADSLDPLQVGRLAQAGRDAAALVRCRMTEDVDGARVILGRCIASVALDQLAIFVAALMGAGSAARELAAATGPPSVLDGWAAQFGPEPDVPQERRPGDNYRDAAALIEAADRADTVTQQIVLLSGGDKDAIAGLLAAAVTDLAHRAFGPDLSGWLAVFRSTADAADRGE